MHQRCANNDSVNIRRIMTNSAFNETLNDTRKGNESLKVTKNKDSVSSVGIIT
ncbi:hypothetical protein [Mucilaginibacter sp.]